MIFDVLVLGAGPAGSSVARRLAATGARVALIGADSRPGWEGLSPRSVALLGEEGVEDRDLRPLGPFARTGRWAAARPVSGAEAVVERARLADVLRHRAVAAGAVHVHAIVSDVVRSAAGWGVHARGVTSLRAPLLVEARGRRGPALRGPVLLGVGQRYETRTALPGGTQILATDLGWAWTVATDRSLWVQVVGRPRSARPRDWLAAAAEMNPSLGRYLHGAQPRGPAVARPAHARLGLHAADAACWPVGDAAVALDPLSGQGVYEALRGARLVASAVGSVLDGGDALLAKRFVAERTQHVWQRSVALAADFYAEWGERSAFWSDTASAYRAISKPAAVAQVRVERRPVLDGSRIVERDVVVTGEQPRGVWHVAGVPLVELKSYLEAAPNATLTGVVAALKQPRAAVLSALRWLQASGVLQSQGSSRVGLGG